MVREGLMVLSCDDDVIVRVTSVLVMVGVMTAVTSEGKNCCK